MCASYDLERDVVFYRMDFDGDGKWEVHGITGASCRRDHTYAAGTYEAVNCLTDTGPDGQELHPDQCQDYEVTATP
jgi:hypothetical protein